SPRQALAGASREVWLPAGETSREVWLPAGETATIPEAQWYASSQIVVVRCKCYDICPGI
ncbi:MAG: hypothetical protein M1115_11305, partial [Actinobacteria bacterium]|nr:hypothetical protein [Actinomycetota bacterium]